jgi:hypothetical protein
MLGLFILIYSGGGGVNFMKYFKGRVSYKSLGISILITLENYLHSSTYNSSLFSANVENE